MGIRCRYVSYPQVEKLCIILAGKILEDGYRPDHLVGIARGGWIPARLLSDLLGISNLSSIRIEHWLTAARREEAELKEGISLDLSGRKLLVVDDVTDTGSTLELGKRYLESLGACVKTGVLHHKSSSRYVPDYYAKSIKRWVWIIYPWHLQEDLGRFIPQLMGSSKFTLGELKQELMRNYGLRLDESELMRALRGLHLRGLISRSGIYWRWRSLS